MVPWATAPQPMFRITLVSIVVNSMKNHTNNNLMCGAS